MADGMEVEPIATWEKDVVRYKVTKVSMPKSVRERLPESSVFAHWWYCGYCTLPIELSESEAAEIEVHGGITWGEREGDAYTYGFDCGHYLDHVNPDCRNLDWVKAECERMAANIIDLDGHRTRSQ